MDLWLIRTAKNQISGPFGAVDVREKILKGELGIDDEICQANNYWVFLHEREEIKKLLGIEPPANLGKVDDDMTETQTEPELTATKKIVTGRQAAQAAPPSSAGNLPVPVEQPFGQKEERFTARQAIAWVGIAIAFLLLVILFSLSGDN